MQHTTNILILGANGQIARVATEQFLRDTDAQLTLYLKNANRLREHDPSRVRIIEGDVLDAEKLVEAMAGQDVVYANLAGRLEQQACNVVDAMRATSVKRLIWVSSMGIYDEQPGELHGSILDPYRKSVAVIEASDLDYTILRPAWLDDNDDIDYQTAQKGEPFKGHTVSRKSVADLIVRLAQTPGLATRESLGIARP